MNAYAERLHNKILHRHIFLSGSRTGVLYKFTTQVKRMNSEAYTILNWI